MDLERDHSSSPKYTREDPVKRRDYRERKKDDEKDLPRPSSRSHHGKSGDSYRYSEHQSSRSSYTHSRHDHPIRQESDHSRPRDYMRDRDKYSRDKYKSDCPRSKYQENEMLSLDRQKYRDEEIHRSDSRRRKSYFEELEKDRNDRDRDDRDKKRDYRRSSGDHQSGWDKEDSKGHRSESTVTREWDGQKLMKERSFEDSDSVKGVDRFNRGVKNPLNDKSIIEGDRNFLAKKPRLFSSDGGPDSGIHGNVTHPRTTPHKKKKRKIFLLEEVF